MVDQSTAKSSAKVSNVCYNQDHMNRGEGISLISQSLSAKFHGILHTLFSSYAEITLKIREVLVCISEVRQFDM